LEENMVRRNRSPAEARRVRRIEVGGFTITEGIHSHGSELPWHHHETPTICFVLHGKFTEMWRGGSIACTSSTMKITPAGERHWDRFSRGDVRGLLIEGGQVGGIAWRVYDEMRRTDATAPLAIEGLLLELVAAASRARGQNGGSAQRPHWLEEAREQIHLELGARPSLSGLAQSVGVHPVTLARAFRRAFGCSVGEYVRTLRIEQATHQLAESELSLAEIALAAGFSDQSHFSNLFRRHTGLSPFRYRQVVRSA
jgi:AraC family transcriptional regulator